MVGVFLNRERSFGLTESLEKLKFSKAELDLEITKMEALKASKVYDGVKVDEMKLLSNSLELEITKIESFLSKYPDHSTIGQH